MNGYSNMTSTAKKLTYIIAAVIISLLSLTTITLTNGGAANASAESVYSSPLADLKADPDFNIEDYPVGGNAYKMEIIQIAESTRNELLVYTYQPYGKIEGSSISISKTINDNYHPKKYSLTLLNYEDVFYKYRVDDFEIEKDALRYYNVPTIWRKYDRQIDGAPSGGITISEIAYTVGKFWTAATVNGTVTYTLKQTETVEIRNPFPGFVRRSKGVSWANNQSCDAHFIAFNTNYDITRLISADVTYRTQDYKRTLIGGTQYSPISETLYRTVNHSEKVSNNVNGLFADNYNWDRISKTSDFIADLDIQDEKTKSELRARKWVINFLETDYTVPAGADNGVAMFGGALGVLYNGFELLFGETSGTHVKEVAVLRLEFEVNGKHYNLGAVSNVVSGPETPSDEIGNAIDEFFKGIGAVLAKIPWWGWLIIFGVIAVIVIFILSFFFPVLRVALQAILKGLQAVFKAIWWVICLPFRGIAGIIRNVRASRERKRETATTKASRPKKKKSRSNSLGTTKNPKQKKPTKEQTGKPQVPNRKKTKGSKAGKTT